MQIKKPPSTTIVYLSPTDVCQSLNPTQIGGTACGALANFSFITLTTGDSGETDHRSDIGFSAFTCPPQICLPVKVVKK